MHLKRTYLYLLFLFLEVIPHSADLVGEMKILPLLPLKLSEFTRALDGIEEESSKEEVAHIYCKQGQPTPQGHADTTHWLSTFSSLAKLHQTLS